MSLCAPPVSVLSGLQGLGQTQRRGGAIVG